jgi:probable rRNA maturation factor
MTKATAKRRSSRAEIAPAKAGVRCAVVVLDTAWAKSLPGAERLVRRAARAAIAGARRGGVKSLNVALADDKSVQALNARDRKKDKPTNVLSYPSGEKSFLGDVVLARQTVWREARAQKKTLADHVTHLVVHGTLHLLGHDHETSDADANRMEALERRILKRLGIADPYLARES